MRQPEREYGVPVGARLPSTLGDSLCQLQMPKRQSPVVADDVKKMWRLSPQKMSCSETDHYSAARGARQRMPAEGAKPATGKNGGAYRLQRHGNPGNDLAATAGAPLA
jgi:hypothetical protein